MLIFNLLLGTEPITVIANNTKPVIEIGAPSTGLGSTFSISIIEIGERDQLGNTIRTISIPDVNFTSVSVQSGKNTMYNFSAQLDNAAFVDVVASF